MNIRVVPYNPEWPAAYEHEAATIARILGNELVAIYHICLLYTSPSPRDTR